MSAPWTKPCPVCGETASCEYEDVGPCNVPVSPYSCEACGWIEPSVSGLIEIDGWEDDL